MIKIRGILLPCAHAKDELKYAAAEKLNIGADDITEFEILYRGTAVLPRGVFFKYDVALDFPRSADYVFHHKDGDILPYEKQSYIAKKSMRGGRAVIVGAGPCGLFAALALAEANVQPIIIERGLPVDERAAKVDLFIGGGELDCECNVQFGEGGAGAFSDGKLKHGMLDARKIKILSEFVAAGAPDEIMYLEKPHIGTDILRGVIKNIRKKIISLGGEFIFSAKMTDIILSENSVRGIVYEKDLQRKELLCDNIILAIGHSARDSFEMLYGRGIKMQAKGFGIGVRIEHPRNYINNLVYGKHNSENLPTADYRFVSHLKNSRSVYTFCMCPGGSVVAAASELGGVVTNGMSNFARDGKNSNSALLVSVTPDDFQGANPLAGFALQRRIENAAYKISGDYKSPVQKLSDFMRGDVTAEIGEVAPSYPRGFVLAELENCLPEFVCSSLRQAITEIDNYCPGFYYPDAVLSAPETRTTSPVKILRGDDMCADSADGLYPCGEGGGYAGGIISSAYDGILAAEKIIEKFQ